MIYPKTLISKLSHGIRFASILVQKPKIFSNKTKYIFVLSHMRSYSTVLSHILGSNKEIVGYSEMFYSYQNWYDLLRLKYKVYIENAKEFNGTYLLDKLLYNSLKIDRKILKEQNIHVIIMIRKPYETIQSIAKLKSNFQNESNYTSNDLVNYYVDRLNGIKNFIESHCEYTNICFFQSETLMEDTQFLLTKLSDWLNLQEPLQSQYSQFQNTGKVGKGDPSDFIKVGRLDKQRHQTPREEKIKIPNSLLSQAEEAYNDLIKISKKYDILKF